MKRKLNDAGVFCMACITVLLFFSPSIFAASDKHGNIWSHEFKARGVIQKIERAYIRVSGQKIYTLSASWINENNQRVSRRKFKIGDMVDVVGKKRQNTHFAKKIKRVNNASQNLKKVALLFVGHGEPAAREDGDAPITLADGTPFGPHGASLGVPVGFQYTEWAAAYEEIATAMTYIFDDSNANGIPHELEIFPTGDVPAFFTWDAFHASVYGHYEACGNYSPHNKALREHVESLEIKVKGAKIDIFLAFLDAVPRIRDVVWDITAADQYEELVVVPMLLASSTHTQEVESLVEEAAHLTSDIEVLVTEPFFEIPYMRKRFRDAVLSMTQYLRSAIPPEVADHNIGVLLASHGTPYSPPYSEFGWQEGEIFSNLINTEDALHADIAGRLPWMSRTGRMNYSSPKIEETLNAFEADGFTHVLVIPSAFPTAAIHTMWDVANAAVKRAVLPHEGIVTHTLPSGMKVYYSAEGFADIEPGRDEFRDGLGFIGQMGVIEALKEKEMVDADVTPYVPCQPGELCVTISADQTTGSQLQFMFYEITEENWPQDFENLAKPGWVIITPPPMPERLPARIRIPLEDNLHAINGGTLDGARLGLAVASSDGIPIDATDARGFSSMTLVYSSGEGMNFGAIDLKVPQAGNTCLPGELCVTVTAQETTGPDLKLMLYEKTTEDQWPQAFLTVPTPDWVVRETVPVPDSFPIHIRIPMDPIDEKLFTISGGSGDGIVDKQLGLAVVTGVASNFIVESTDARGFSTSTLVYQPGAVMNYGSLELAVPQGDTCELNPYHPDCLTGPLLWKKLLLGDTDFVPGAIYLDVADIDQDGTDDIVMVGEPHFEEPNLPLTVLKLGIYYLNKDFSINRTEIIDQWTESDPAFYSPWGVRVIEHSGAPMIIVGLNIPGLAPLEDGTGAVFSYRKDGTTWVRSVVRENPNPTEENYNSMIVVPCDIDNDGDTDLALSGAFDTSAVGSWMENTGEIDNPWIPHLVPMTPGTDPYIRGTLAYKSADLNRDGYPEVVYNAMFDIPNTNPPRYRGEIWLGINPGPAGWTTPWPIVVVDADNWASADMWFHDFDGDGFEDLIANQIFNTTVTRYWHPGSENLNSTWSPQVIISGLTSPSDMWLADMDEDGLMDVVSADHTAHRGVWHKNPGPDSSDLWQPNLIFRNIRLPGDFAMFDLDEDGDLDWLGTSLTRGQAFVMEQVHPAASLVANLSLPENFDGQIRQLMLVLTSDLPLAGLPDATLLTIENDDSDGDGEGDVDQLLSSSRDLTLALEDVGVSGKYHVLAVLFMEGGGNPIPVPGIDYMASSGKLEFGLAQVEVALELEPVPPVP